MATVNTVNHLHDTVDSITGDMAVPAAWQYEPTPQEAQETLAYTESHTFHPQSAEVSRVSGVTPDSKNVSGLINRGATSLVSQLIKQMFGQCAGGPGVSKEWHPVPELAVPMNLEQQAELQNHDYSELCSSADVSIREHSVSSKHAKSFGRTSDSVHQQELLLSDLSLLSSCGGPPVEVTAAAEATAQLYDRPPTVAGIEPATPALLLLHTAPSIMIATTSKQQWPDHEPTQPHQHSNATCLGPVPPGPGGVATTTTTLPRAAARCSLSKADSTTNHHLTRVAEDSSSAASIYNALLQRISVDILNPSKISRLRGLIPSTGQLQSVEAEAAWDQSIPHHMRRRSTRSGCRESTAAAGVHSGSYEGQGERRGSVGCGRSRASSVLMLGLMEAATESVGVGWVKE